MVLTGGKDSGGPEVLPSQAQLNCFPQPTQGVIQMQDYSGYGQPPSGPTMPMPPMPPRPPRRRIGDAIQAAITSHPIRKFVTGWELDIQELQ